MDDATGPHFAASVLVTIDTQRDTLDGGPFEVPGTSAVVPNVVRLCRGFRLAGRPIVHVVRLYRRDGGNAELCRREAVRGATPMLWIGDPGRLPAPGLLQEGAPELDDDLLLEGGIQRFGPQEVVIYKPRWGAFFRTPLEAHLGALGVDTLVFAGCNFPNCPRTSIYEASERDFRTVLVDDAVSGLYDRGREEMGSIGVNLLTTEEVLSALSTR